jgi:imidazoleglycerol-phosphate dehydratase
MSRAAPGVRYAEVLRETSETRVEVVLDIDGAAPRGLETGISFFDHMLGQLAFHGQLALGIHAEGDLHVDDHHLIEDVGIVLGQAIAQALDSEEPIARFGSSITPMDEALVMVALDVSGRGALFWDLDFKRERLGQMATEAVEEFFGAMARHGGLTLHIRKISGSNDHHLCTAIFKGVGLCLYQATRKLERRGPSSTKGTRG